MYLPIKLKEENRPIIEALIDSGAQGTLIHPSIVQQYHLQTKQKVHPLQAVNVDGTNNKMGLITKEIPLSFQWSNQEESDPWMHVVVHVADIGQEDFIIGYDLLEKYNPIIN